MTKTKGLAAVIAAVVVGAAAPQLAAAGHWWRADNGQVVHLNKGRIPGISFYNHTTNGSWTAVEHARGKWSESAYEDLYNYACQCADVVAWDGYWATDWSGLATPYAWDGYHAGQFGVQINLSSKSYASGANYSGTRAVACQELGHSIGGMVHQGPGCMGVGWDVFDPWNDAQQRYPSTHDFDHVAYLWGVAH